MTYRIKKSIKQYSLVDLMEIIQNSQHPEYEKSKEEFKKRKPSKKELEIAIKGLEIRLKSRNKPLSLIDKIYCFIIPFSAAKDPFTSDSTEISNEYERQMQEFEMYGETRRIEELRKWQKYGRITYLGLISVMILVFVILILLNAIRQIING